MGTLMSKDSLNGCPFCGGDASITEGMGEYWVLCDECKASGAMAGSKEGATAAWNKRGGCSGYPEEHPLTGQYVVDVKHLTVEQYKAEAEALARYVASLPQQREMQLLTGEEQLDYCAEDIMKMLADHVHNCQTPLQTKLCALIRPYIAKPEPVMVSLEKCATALKQKWLRSHEIGINLGIAWLDLAKTVLDAAGVKYVD